FGTPLHSWQLVAQGRTSVAHKGMCLAGKTLAATALALFSETSLLAEARQEFRRQRAEQPYRCPIPAGVIPTPLA
ncbi:MAG TPA: amidohydrolase, partial [Erwinia persicina]|nr:amidohydrolase [Erwinia persicina]